MQNALALGAVYVIFYINCSSEAADYTEKALKGQLQLTLTEQAAAVGVNAIDPYSPFTTHLKIVSLRPWNKICLFIIL